MRESPIFKKLLIPSLCIAGMINSHEAQAFNIKHFVEHDVGDKVKHTATHGVDQIGKKFKSIEHKMEKLTKDIKKIEDLFKKLEKKLEKIPHTMEKEVKIVQGEFNKIKDEMEKIPHKIEEGVKSLSHLAVEGLEKAGFSPKLMKKTAMCFIPFLEQLKKLADHPMPTKAVETIKDSECYQDINEFADTCNKPLLITASMLPYVGQSVGTFCAKIDHLVGKFDAMIDKLELEAETLEKNVHDVEDMVSGKSAPDINKVARMIEDVEDEGSGEEENQTSEEDEDSNNESEDDPSIPDADD